MHEDGCADDLYHRADDVTWQELGGELVLLALETGSVLRLNRVGILLWEQLAEPRTVAELADVLIARFRLEPSIANRDVQTFLKPLVAAKFCLRIE